MDGGVTEPLEGGVPWLTAPSLEVSVEFSVRKLALDRRRSSLKLRKVGAMAGARLSTEQQSQPDVTGEEVRRGRRGQAEAAAAATTVAMAVVDGNGDVMLLSCVVMPDRVGSGRRVQWSGLSRSSKTRNERQTEQTLLLAGASRYYCLRAAASRRLRGCKN